MHYVFVKVEIMKESENYQLLVKVLTLKSKKMVLYFIVQYGFDQICF